MAKNSLFGCFLLIIATAIYGCTPAAIASTPAPENVDPLAGAQQTITAATQGVIDPVVGAQQTLDAATQKSMEAVVFAQETLAAADPELVAFNPNSLPARLRSLPDDQNIEAQFTGRVVCSQFEIKLTNRGTAAFKSMLVFMSLKDDPADTVITSFTNGFVGYSSTQTDTGDCQSPSLSPSLDPGASYTISFPRFTEKTDSTFEGSIALCSENDLGGQCSKNSIVFSAPEEIPQTPAPTPLAPELFAAEYANTVHPCNETWWVRINLTNKFDSAFKSMSISVKDVDTGEIASESDEHTVFVDLDQTICNPDIDVGHDNLLDDLDPNQSFTVSSGVFRNDPTNDSMEATLTLCTEEDLGGQCSAKTINFTPGVSAEPTVDTTKPDYPYIILSEGTNCRTGPGTVFDVIGRYPKDTKIPVLGKDPAGEYWVVESPNRGDTNINCWLDGDWVKEKGNVEKVEIILPPSTPTSTPRPPTSTPTQTPTETLTPTSTP
jgi:hypothetical protein